MGVQLESKGGVGSEGVGVEIREALGDVGRRESEPEVLDRTAERRCFVIQVQDTLLLLLSEYQRDVLFVVLPATSSHYVCCPC